MSFNFNTPKWDSNTSVEKTCKELFTKPTGVKRKFKPASTDKPPNIKTSKLISQNANTKKKKVHKSENTKRNTKQFKTNQLQKTIISAEPTTARVANAEKPLQKKIKRDFKNRNSNKGQPAIDVPTPNFNINKQKNLDKTKQVDKKHSKMKKIHNMKEKLGSEIPMYMSSRKQLQSMSLRERMMEKLKGARFRYLNEQMYINPGHDSKKYFEQNPSDYKAYHEGYRQQVSRWPLNPVDIIIEKIKKMPKNYIIADFGCGEAKLAKSVPQTVHSFDLVAIDNDVIACDMRNVPLQNGSVDIVVFCLSLMGTNLKEYICEASRVLKTGGTLKIAEVESRFENIDTFIQGIQKFGFTKADKDVSNELFWFVDFIKKEGQTTQRKKLPDIHLNPCLYKRR